MKSILIILGALFGSGMFALLFWLGGEDFPTERGQDLIRFIFLFVFFGVVCGLVTAAIIVEFFKK